MAKKSFTAPSWATNTIQLLADLVKDQAATLKAKFDLASSDIKTYVADDLLVELQDETLGNSGSNTIGHNSTSITADNVGDGLEEIKLLADDNESRIGTEEGALTTHKSSGDHDGRYYTEIELDAGQLDNRYYTETEIAALTGSNLMGHTSANVVAEEVGLALEEIAVIAKSTNPTLNVFSALDYGVVDDGTTDVRQAMQDLFDLLSEGDTVVFPKNGSYYKVINATGVGVNPVDQRADAVLNNTLYPVTCSTNNITVVIEGDIKETSLLGNLLELSGDNVIVKGNGSINGIGGSDADGYLDTTYTGIGDITIQWQPSLLKLTGKNSDVENVEIFEPPTIGIHLNGSEPTVKKCRFSGGKTVHGAGTWLFGVYLDIGADRALVEDNLCEKDVTNGNVYELVFDVSSNSIITKNKILETLEHGIYSYGDGVEISSNYIDGNGMIGAVIQVFSENFLVEKNYCVNAELGGIALQKGSNGKTLNNKLFGVGLSGISLRTLVGDVDYFVKNFTVENNEIYFNPVLTRQSGIDIQILYSGENFTIKDNFVSEAFGSLAPSPIAGFIIRSLTALETIKNVRFSGNHITECDGYAGYLDRVENSKFDNNKFVDNATDGLSNSLVVGIRFFNTVNTTFEKNSFEDRRGTTINTFALYEDTGCINNYFNDNISLGFTTANNMRLNAGSDTIRFKNRKVDLPLYGMITMPAVAVKNFLNSDSNGIDGLMTNATVKLTPMNKPAGLLQGSSQQLIVQLVNGIGTLQITTADATIPPDGTAEFLWEVIQ